MHAGPWLDLRLLTLSFTAGVLAVHALPHLPPLPWLPLMAVPALFPWRARWTWLALAAGVALTAWRAQVLLDDRWPAALHGEDRWVEGTVASVPETRLHEGGLSDWRLLFEPVDEAVPARIRVGWYRTTQAVHGGECWRLRLRLRTPHGSFNPGGFDYEGWLFRQGVGATATVRDAHPCPARPGYHVLRWRQQLVDDIRAALPPTAALGLVLALTVGDRSAFGDRDWDIFRATGTTHLVAISGFNIAIVAGFAFFLFRWLWSAWPALCLWLPAQRAGLLGSALVAGFYALIAGFEPPVARALLMCWLVLVAVWSHRMSEPSRVLALAWLAILLLDPLAILSPGLWLSFAAVAAIFYVSLHRLRAPGLWHGAVLLQLMLAVALAPITLYFFQGASWLAPVVNLAAVPVFALLTPWVLAGVTLHLLWPAIGGPLLSSAAWALDWVHAGLAFAAQAPDLWLPASPPAAALGLALIGVVLLFAPRGVPLRLLGIVCLVPLLLVPPTPPRGGFEVTTLDVGQGLAVVVRTAHHTLLYDAGPAFDDGFDAGASVVAPFLLQQGVRKLDLLFLSHGDNDHDGGVDSVRKLLAVAAEIGTPETTPCAEGMAWSWDGVRFEVLHPRDAAYSENDASCVLRIKGAFSVLLAGDIEADAEARLLHDRPDDLRADLLIAPHHGSATSSTAEFVDAVHPQVVAYGAGWRHHFRHPRPTVVARYEAIGARQVVTGSGGALSVWKERERLEVGEFRRDSARFWNAAPGP